MEEKDIRKIAVRYFEGEISPEEERALFAYLHDVPERLAAFRRWEQEWAEARPDDFLAADWARLQQRLRMREDERRREAESWRFRLGQMGKYAAAAAVFLALFVGVYSLLADKEAAPEEFYAVETANGERTRVVLPDGTSIYLNSGSTLRYSNRFNRENRRVELDGEAYFEVTKQAGEQPFAVVTSDYEIVVKGTKFNVSSYAEDPVTTTSLLEGNIDVSRGQERYSVEPGEAVRLDRETGQMSLYRTDAQQSTSWMSGDLVYDRITLRELAARLSRKYDLPIRLDDGLDGETEFRISLRSEESIESVLNALGRIIPVRPVKEGQEIVIKKR